MFHTFVKTNKDDKEHRLKEKKHEASQQRIAEQERQRMKEFDDYLVLAKYNPWIDTGSHSYYFSVLNFFFYLNW